MSSLSKSRVPNVRGRAFAGARVALLLVVVAAGTNLPVPILLIYQQQMALSNDHAAGLFGVYAAGLIPTVLLAGPLSDLVGRRRLVLAGGVIAAAVSAFFAMSETCLLYTSDAADELQAV